MKKFFAMAFAVIFLMTFTSCSQTQPADLINMHSLEQDGKFSVIWEGRTYFPFCVVSKSDCSQQIGYVNGDTDNRISRYKDLPAEEWLVSWLTTDGGAILLKEQSVTEIPDGLQAEYD